MSPLALLMALFCSGYTLVLVSSPLIYFLLDPFFSVPGCFRSFSSLPSFLMIQSCLLLPLPSRVFPELRCMHFSWSHASPPSFPHCFPVVPSPSLLRLFITAGVCNISAKICWPPYLAPLLQAISPSPWCASFINALRSDLPHAVLILPIPPRSLYVFLVSYTKSGQVFLPLSAPLPFLESLTFGVISGFARFYFSFFVSVRSFVFWVQRPRQFACRLLFLPYPLCMPPFQFGYSRASLLNLRNFYSTD